MQGMLSINIYSGSSDDGVTFTTEVDFGPGFLVGTQATLAWSDGEGLHRTGIAGYRSRPTPNGPDVPVNFGDWPSWANNVWVQDMTAVVFGTVVGGNQQECFAVCNVYFW